MPLRQFQGDALRPIKIDELAVVKVHDVVAELDAVSLEPGHLGLDIVHGKADVVVPQFVEFVDMRVGDGVGVMVFHQLNFLAHRRGGQRQGHVPGLDALDPHILRNDAPGDNDVDVHLKAQEPEEAHGFLHVPDHEGNVIEAFHHL